MTPTTEMGNESQTEDEEEYNSWYLDMNGQKYYLDADGLEYYPDASLTREQAQESNVPYVEDEDRVLYYAEKKKLNNEPNVKDDDGGLDYAENNLNIAIPVAHTEDSGWYLDAQDERYYVDSSGIEYYPDDFLDLKDAKECDIAHVQDENGVLYFADGQQLDADTSERFANVDRYSFGTPPSLLLPTQDLPKHTKTDKQTKKTKKPKGKPSARKSHPEKQTSKTNAVNSVRSKPSTRKSHIEKQTSKANTANSGRPKGRDSGKSKKRTSKRTRLRKANTLQGPPADFTRPTPKQSHMRGRSKMRRAVSLENETTLSSLRCNLQRRGSIQSYSRRNLADGSNSHYHHHQYPVDDSVRARSQRFLLAQPPPSDYPQRNLMEDDYSSQQWQTERRISMGNPIVDIQEETDWDYQETPSPEASLGRDDRRTGFARARADRVKKHSSIRQSYVAAMSRCAQQLRKDMEDASQELKMGRGSKAIPRTVSIDPDAKLGDDQSVKSNLTLSTQGKSIFALASAAASGFNLANSIAKTAVDATVHTATTAANVGLATTQVAAGATMFVAGAAVGATVGVGKLAVNTTVGAANTAVHATASAIQAADTAVHATVDAANTAVHATVEAANTGAGAVGKTMRPMRASIMRGSIFNSSVSRRRIDLAFKDDPLESSLEFQSEEESAPPRIPQSRLTTAKMA